jgi:hypothetical protein
MIHPRAFRTEYVEPAIALWKESQTVKHLAIHAIAQIDVLAEVVALWTLLAGRSNLDQDEVTRFRNELGNREPALTIVRDAHDSHKHGALIRKTATKASQGQRPEIAIKGAFFYDHSFYDSPLLPYEVLVFFLNDGTEKRVSIILAEAMRAWDRELTRLGLCHNLER